MSERIRDVEARLGQSFTSLGAKWTGFVEQVKDGYGLAIPNYTNSLTVRDMLEEGMSAVSEKDRQLISRIVEPADALFRSATRDDPEDLLSRFMRHRDHWWWYRVPLVLGTLAGEYGIFPAGDPRRSG